MIFFVVNSRMSFQAVLRKDRVSSLAQSLQIANGLLINFFISLKGTLMTKFLYVGLIAFALAAFASPSSVQAQCAHSVGYGNFSPSYGYSNYSPVHYSNSYYAPSYGYSNNYAPSYGGRQNYYGGGYNDLRSQRIRRLATVAIVAGVVVAASNSNGNRSRNRNRRH